MEYKNIHIIYFSPTHTSAKTAYAIAEGLSGDVLLESDITYDAPAEELEIHDDELTIVAAPVYGGRVAETAMERLRAFHAHQAPVVPVVVYGNRDYEDALKELSDTLVDAGFVPVSAGAFVGEHSFSRKDMPIAAGRPEDLCTQCEYCIDVCPVSAISIVDDRMFSDPATCIKCCACVKECPEGARTFDTPYTAMLHKNFSARREPELFI